VSAALVSLHAVLRELEHIHGAQRSLAARRLLLARALTHTATTAATDLAPLTAYAQSHWHPATSSSSAASSSSSAALWRVVSVSLAAERVRMMVCAVSEGAMASARVSDSLLGCLIVALSDAAAKQRCAALRALGAAVVADARVLEDPRVLSALRVRLGEQAPVVREAALELLGHAIAAGRSLAELHALSSLIARLSDRGLGVRKRAMAVARQVCVQLARVGDSGAQAVASTLCARIAQRALDEEASARDAAVAVLRGLLLDTSAALAWRGALLLSAVAMAVRDHRNAPAVLDKQLRWLAELLSVAASAEPVEVAEMLAWAVEQIVQAPLLSVEQPAVEEAETDTAVLVSPSSQLSAAVLVQLLVRAVPVAAVRHLAVLQPVLRRLSDLAASSSPSDEVGEALLVALRLLDVVAVVAAQATPLPVVQGEALVRDLTQLVYKAPGQHAVLVMNAAVRALCALVEHGHAPVRPLDTLYAHMANHLASYGEHRHEPPKQGAARVALVRALIVLAALVRHHCFDVEEATQRVATHSLEELRGLQYGAHTERVFSELSAFYRNAEIIIRVAALRALLSLGTTLPALVLRSDAMVKSAVISQDKRLRQHALVFLEDFLVDDEAQLQRAAKQRSHDADTGATGALLATLQDTLRLRLSDTEDAIRLSALTLLEHVLRRRLLHPVPYVVPVLAACADGVQSVADKAVAVARLLHSLGADMLLSRQGEALTAAYEAQMARYHHTIGTSLASCPRAVSLTVIVGSVCGADHRGG